MAALVSAVQTCMLDGLGGLGGREAELRPTTAGADVGGAAVGWEVRHTQSLGR